MSRRLSYREWSDAEEAVLRERYGAVKVSDIAMELGRNRSSVYSKAHQMGLDKPKNQFVKWSDEEIIKLKELYNSGTPITKISSLLGRSYPSVSWKLADCGLSEGGALGNRFTVISKNASFRILGKRGCSFKLNEFDIEGKKYRVYMGVPKITDNHPSSLSIQIQWNDGRKKITKSLIYIPFERKCRVCYKWFMPTKKAQSVCDSCLDEKHKRALDRIQVNNFLNGRFSVRNGKNVRKKGLFEGGGICFSCGSVFPLHLIDHHPFGLKSDYTFCLCYNCHRILHYYGSENWIENNLFSSIVKR